MRELVERILAGDTEAFMEIVREHNPAVRAYFAGFLQDSHEVDDLAQETLIAAYEALPRFRPDMDLGHWIHGIACNKLRKHLRQTYHRRSGLEQLRARILEQLSTEVREVVGAAARTQVDRLNHCMARLSRRVRVMFRKRYCEDIPVKVIAEDERSTPGAISALLHRGRKQMQSCLEGGESA
jgi:RNA polymerase sigma-70 factor (ECF subfamily)